MVHAGESWRFAVGSAAVAIDAIIFSIGLPFIFARRLFNPIRALSAPLVTMLLLCKLPLIIMFDFREAGFVQVNCATVTWLVVLMIGTSSIPPLCFLYRIQLIAEYENEKVQFATSQQPSDRGRVGDPSRADVDQSKPLQDGAAAVTVEPLTSTAIPTHMSADEMTRLRARIAPRVFLYGLLVFVPVFLGVPLLLEVDQSTDYATIRPHGTCRYYGYGMLVWLGVAVFNSIIGGRVQYRLDHVLKVPDVLGVRRDIYWIQAYGFPLFVAFLILNCVLPDINEDTFESSILMWSAGTIVDFHIITGWVLRTFRLEAAHKRGLRRGCAPAASQPRVLNLGVVAPAWGSAKQDEPSGSSRTVNSTTHYRPGGGNTSQSRRALRHVLSDQKAFDCFLLFCKAEFAAENVLFWKAVAEFRRAAMATSGGEAGVIESSAAAAGSEVALSRTLHRSMLSIWSTFVRPNATLQVNLSSRNQLLVRKRLEHFVRTFHGISAEAATLQTEAAAAGLVCEHVTATPAYPQAPSINSATVVPLSIAAQGESKELGPGISVGLSLTDDPELVSIPFIFDDAAREILCVMVRTKHLRPRDSASLIHAHGLCFAVGQEADTFTRFKQHPIGAECRSVWVGSIDAPGQLDSQEDSSSLPIRMASQRPVPAPVGADHSSTAAHTGHEAIALSKNRFAVSKVPPPATVPLVMNC